MAAMLSSSPAWVPKAQDVTRDLDLRQDELLAVLDLAAQVKRTPPKFAQQLRGQYLGLLFEKPSLRTRLTFELAIKQLGGDAVVSIGPLGGREPIKDVARNLDRWTQAIVARTFLQATVDELARWSTVPVINALSDLWHPCQALADLQTIRERLGRWQGVRVAYVGDGNNVAHSLMVTALRLGCAVSVATPEGYAPHESVLAEARTVATETGARLWVGHDAGEAVRDADVVYTDVWTSMGQEEEAELRQATFRPYQVNGELMSRASAKAIFLHCLPAKRGQEVTDEVIESPQSAVFDQAENRLHAQKGLLVHLLG